MTESIKRTGEIEEFTNLTLIHPISGWLVPHFAALGISPNMVSLTGMLCGGLSGWAYYHYADPWFAVLGFGLMFVWHVMDGADGQLARLTNTQSEIGKVIDGICDYVTFISVYVGLGLATNSPLGWALLGLAGMSHAVQSGAYELQRQEFDYWGKGKQSARLANPDDLPGPGRSPIALLIAIYTKMQYRFSGIDQGFWKRLEAADHTDKFREDYRLNFAPMVRSWAILCANYRTFAIFVACIVGEPVFYFIFEIVVLNLSLFVLVHKKKKYNAAFDALPR